MASQGQEHEIHDACSSPVAATYRTGSQSDEQDVSMSSMSKRRRTSKVWKHFDRKEIDGVWKAICNYCHRHLSGIATHGTTHLSSHLDRCPALEGIGGNVRKLTMTREALKASFNQADAKKSLASMILMHEYPLSIVEHRGFRNFLKILQPAFKCPSRNTIKSDILDINAIEKKKMMEEFERCGSRVAITSDMWTSNYQRRGYMAVTAHYIDSSWTLQSRIIRFAYVPCPHTKEVLSKVLMRCLHEWNLDTRLSSVTLDNCTTNDAMINVIKSQIQIEEEQLIDFVRVKIPSHSMMLSGRFIHMRCCTHILNLIVKDGLSVIKDGVEKVRASVSYWIATSKRQEKFEDTTKLMKIDFSKKMCLDCETRWNSTYLMLQVALVYKDVFFRLSLREPKYTKVPSEEDWKFCANICEKLEVFFVVTELFSGTKYPTINLYFPNMCHIRENLVAWFTSSDAVIYKWQSLCWKSSKSTGKIYMC